MKCIFYILIILLLACQSDPRKIPENVLNQNEMTQLLFAIHRADGMAVSENIVNPKLLHQVKKTYLRSIFKSYDISEEEFEKSMTFYESQPQLLFEIYEQVMIEIATEEAKLNGENKELENKQ